MFTGLNQKLTEELLEAIRFFNLKGWSPATSTNYSVRSENKSEYIISRSGVDKSKFCGSDLILINQKGEILPPFNKPGIKSSAETEIHTAVYEMFPEVNCVLHTHSVLGTVLSHSLVQEKQIRFEGFEILKGIEGNKTHDLVETLPIVPNSQVMSEILNNVKGRLDKNSHGFLIAGHGLYSWGKDIATAKRHIETYEFLFECYHMMRRF
ncbi:methylthioribulose 1-phosphate dehydratase [Peredibacter sp. HCB2-198]|uniref:methylthioribulose 1-phosphate dehydratase n=1 Tax=Peredibacter sp. HCB2-198 TaxID=3383025 RepID=UPI0038B52DCB